MEDPLSAVRCFSLNGKRCNGLKRVDDGKTLETDDFMLDIRDRVSMYIREPSGHLAILYFMDFTVQKEEWTTRLFGSRIQLQFSIISMGEYM